MFILIPAANQLTEQQQKIYELVQQGFKRREILSLLNISVETYKTQIKRMKNADKEKRGTKGKKAPRVNSVLRTKIIGLYQNGCGKKQTEIAKTLGLSVSQVSKTIDKYVTNEKKRHDLVNNRKQRCMTTEFLSVESGISHQEIIDIENGTLVPNKQVYDKLNAVIFIKHNEFPRSPAEELAELIEDKNLIAAARSVYGGGAQEINSRHANYLHTQLAINGVGCQNNLFKQRAQRIQVMAATGKQGKHALRLSSEQRYKSREYLKAQGLKPLEIDPEDHSAIYIATTNQAENIKYGTAAN